MSAAPEIACVGEAMLMLTPEAAAPLESRPALAMEVGGAESNVACGLAGLGRRAAWLSRVGDDPFGRVVTATLAGHGVDVSGVEVDPVRPTGLYAKDPGPDGTTVYYYRAGSAAAAMGPELADHPLLRRAGMVHLSGVTPALAPGCAALTERLVDDPGHRVSFDVNHRPRLWTGGGAAERLLDLARRADLVFVGRDEAERLWDTATAEQVRDLVGGGTLVVKDAEHGATEFAGDERVHVPAPRVDVVEPVGAGDAFAAGYLCALVDGRPAHQRLRLGHLCAGRALRRVGDLAPPPPASLVTALLDASEAEWAQRAAAAVSAE